MLRTIALAATFAVLGTSAAAQQQAQQPKPVTRAQYNANADAAFGNIDMNHDGSISLPEIQAAEAKTKQQIEAVLRARAQAQFKALDTNKDGQLSLAEFLAVVPPVKANDDPAAILKQLDTNHDGKISAAEFKAPKIAAFNKADTNHDGTLSVEEQRAATGQK